MRRTLLLLAIALFIFGVFFVYKEIYVSAAPSLFTEDAVQDETEKLPPEPLEEEKNEEKKEDDIKKEEPITPKETSPEIKKDDEKNKIQIEESYDGSVVIVMAVVIVILLAVNIFLIYKNNKRNNKKAFVTDTTFFSNNKESLQGEINFRVGNFHHIGCREEQQDSFCISDISDKKSLHEKGIMAVVADGMGGMEGGALISQLVVDAFRESYNRINSNFEPATFLYDTAKKAEFIIDDYKKQTGINGGSTLVAVIIKESKLYTLSVGDSKIYLLRDGKLVQLNHEHTFGAFLKEQVEQGEVSPEEPYTNPKREALTAYIGMGSLKKVDCGKPIFLKLSDKILLCSDGVSNALKEEAIIVALNVDALTAAERIEKFILAQDIPTQDNFTGVILECTSMN